MKFGFESLQCILLAQTPCDSWLVLDFTVLASFFRHIKDWSNNQVLDSRSIFDRADLSSAVVC